MAKSSISTAERVARYRRRARCAVIAGVLLVTIDPIVDPSPSAIASAAIYWLAGAIFWIVADISKQIVDDADRQNGEQEREE